MIRPMFSNLHKSPVPQFGQFRECPLDLKIPVLMGPSWNKTFALKSSDLFEVPLFNRKAYQAWRKFFWPIIKEVLYRSSTEQLQRMYSTTLAQVMSEYRTMCNSAMLHQQLEELGKIHQYLRPTELKDVFEAPTVEYLQADATN